MFDSEVDEESQEKSSEGLVPIDGSEGQGTEGDEASADTEFTPWREEPLPLKQTTGLGHRRLIKKGKVRQGTPMTISHEVSLEPESAGQEQMEITPLMENDTIVGLHIRCGCGSNQEVRFEYSDKE
ncbi:MAG: hypothetical protein JSW54_10845 [Fidelibacterota bacterium]|nr:MAG: hypothetical protein JSW54_10845 [Candidatus Neomarinimicrobiota bacterium]